MLLTLELLEGEDGLLDSHVVEGGLLCETDLGQGLAGHEQAGVGRQRMADRLGNERHCAGRTGVCLDDVHLHQGEICFLKKGPVLLHSCHTPDLMGGNFAKKLHTDVKAGSNNVNVDICPRTHELAGKV